jgi:Cof subfamily protein (haloacid dehalogenase superfamily)
MITETKPVRMIALDLDDTLLRSDLTISYRTRTAIKKAEAAGITVVLASGRIWEAMLPFVRFLGMHKRTGYLVCSNGTTIVESKSGKVVYEVCLPVEPALTAFNLLEAEGFAVQLYEGGILYVSRTNEFTEYDKKLTGLQQIVAPDFRDMIRAGCHKLLIPGDPMLLKPLESLLATYLDKELTLFTSKPYFLEILPHETDKGTALSIVAEKLGIERETIMAIGDSMNDASMLEWAGIGVAMLNGDARIKALADKVTKSSNDDDGVAEIIEQVLINKGFMPL